jgi:hypothetical protein
MTAKLTAKPTRKTTRAHKLCFNVDFRGYRHHCARMLISERQHGPAAAPLMCTDPYRVNGKRSQFGNACS